MSHLHGPLKARLTSHQWLDWIKLKEVKMKVIRDEVSDPQLHPPDSMVYKNYNRKSARDVNPDEDSSSDDEKYQSIYGDMNNLDIESMISSQVPVRVTNTDVYKHYDFTEKPDTGLPIFHHRKELLSTIQSHPVTIVHGSTGTGKSTQLPMYILEQHASRNKYCNIIVTQPRKIAAVSVARRVSRERKWQVGQVVGYQVGLEKQASVDTRITYVTTGVLLQMLIKAKSLNAYTHVILDEVHERDSDTDLALLIVKKLLFLNSRHVKVVLMSATMDTTDFAKYFSHVIDGPLGGGSELAPTVPISGRMFKVTQTFLDDLTAFGNPPQHPHDDPYIDHTMYELAAKLIWDLDQKENSLNKDKSTKGAVLVFLPGLYQIQEMEAALRNSQASRYFLIIPLHSTITLDEQRNVFAPPKDGYRKIILSTNIAESSLTVPDVKYVVDFCLTKCVVTDHLSNYQSLQLQWASKSNCQQRAGRAGRVSDGMVFHLVTRSFWTNYLPQYSQPELQRCSLESAILRVKQLDLGSPKRILQYAMSPPDLTNIARSIMLLREVGAIGSSSKRLDGPLTFVGQVLASLPMDMRLGKLLILGYVFGCLNECIVIAACLSKPSFMVSSYHHNVESYKKKLEWARGSFSDCLSCLYAYKDFEKRKEDQDIKTHRDAMTWARKNHIHLRRLKEVESQVQDLKERLARLNIHAYANTPVWPGEFKNDSTFILQVVIAGAFYPNYFEQSYVNEQTAFRDISTLNPNTNIVITNIPEDEGPLCKNSILHSVSSFGKCKNLYYNGSKVMVEFEDTPSIDTGAILPAVYIACKARMNTRKHLQIYRTYKKTPRSGSLHSGDVRPSFYFEEITKSKYKRLLPQPGPESVNVPVIITHVDSLTSFWGMLESSKSTACSIADLIVSSLRCKISLKSVKVNDLVLAPYTDGKSVEYYRALVLTNEPYISIWYVDYGNKEIIKDVTKLMALKEDLREVPFLAVKFELCQTVAVANNELLTSFMVKLFEKVNNNAQVKVYSVVSDVVRVELFVDGLDCSINQFLIDEGKCDQVDESLYSTQEHKVWELAEEDEETFKKWTCPWKPVDDLIRGPTCEPQGHDVAKGPHSTLETNFHSLLKVGKQKNVKVGHSSINSVTLCQDLTSTNSVVMVAADVFVSQMGGTMMCRDTTILPSIPDLSSLLCLLFSPIVELRYDEDKSNYASALCGLGAVRNEFEGTDAVMPEHDIEISFKREITNDDVEMVNGIRTIVNMAIGDSKKISEWSQQVMRKMQVTIRKRILSFLYKPRVVCEERPSSHPYYWNEVNEDSMSKPDYYPLHKVHGKAEPRF